MGRNGRIKALSYCDWRKRRVVREREGGGLENVD